MESTPNMLAMIIAAVLVACILSLAVWICKKIAPNQIDKIREWLVYATAIAEKELGGGTGRLKLRYVYDMFMTKFPWLSKIVSFEFFSDIVDEALDEMNYLIDTNTAIQEFVKSEPKYEFDNYSFDEISID